MSDKAFWNNVARLEGQLRYIQALTKAVCDLYEYDADHDDSLHESMRDSCIRKIYALRTETRDMIESLIAGEWSVAEETKDTWRDLDGFAKLCGIITALGKCWQDLYLLFDGGGH